MGSVPIALPAATANEPPASTRRRAVLHALCTLVPLLLLAAYFAGERVAAAVKPSPSGSPPARLVWYREHRQEFDLLWLGDSRTYCAMDPVVHDPLLGRRSLNMAIWALWFPEQWAFFEDLLPEVPPTTALCWSIGHQNFIRTPTMLGTVYPLGTGRALRYLAFGYDWSNVRGNLYRYAEPLELLRRTEGWHKGIDGWLSAPLDASPPAVAAIDNPATRALQAEAAALLARVQADPTTASAKIRVDDGHPTSVEAFTTLGSYRRFELDPAYFRQKQQEIAAGGNRVHVGFVDTGMQEFHPDPLLWATFERILDLLAASGLRVIVNELEEAPFCYADAAGKECIRRFMRERVKPAVEARGLAYVRADLDRLGDTDYFDYNHLNTVGTVRYAPLLANVLRPHLRRD